MHVRVSDARALPALVAHLVRQGFPATPSGDGVAEILFPGEPGGLCAAAELDLWAAANGDLEVTAVDPREA